MEEKIENRERKVPGTWVEEKEEQKRGQGKGNCGRDMLCPSEDFYGKLILCRSSNCIIMTLK